MALNPRVVAAAASLSAEFTAGNGRLGRVAQVGGPPLTRLDCFVSKPWREMAAKLADPTVQGAALDLLDHRCPAVPGSDYDSWYYIDRGVLMGLSAAARQRNVQSDDRLVQLWLATMIWGHARDNRGPGKVLEALTSCGNVLTTLRHSIALLDAGNLAGAYSSCAYNGAGYLSGFGESFFTKWLWSAGLASGLLPLPLVFDDRVRDALRSLGTDWKPQGRNVAQRYVDYCGLADDVARHLTATLGHLDAEKVEYALYCV